MSATNFTSSDGQTVEGILRKTAVAFERMTPDTVRAMQDRGVEVVRAAAAAYHITNPRGAKVRLTARPGSLTPTGGSVLGIGPWMIVEAGSVHQPSGWDIRPKGRLIRRRRYLKTPYGPRLQVHHPFLPPLGRPWEESQLVLDHELPVIVDQSIDRATRSIWR